MENIAMFINATKEQVLYLCKYFEYYVQIGGFIRACLNQDCLFMRLHAW